jgi:inhibitor of KinA
MDLVPLGDAAALAYLPDETAALCLAEAVRRSKDAWVIDVVHAYASVAVFFDLHQTRFAEVAERLRETARTNAVDKGTIPSRLHRIPCCYEFAPDLPRMVQVTGLHADEVIRIHAETEYTVYAIGFSPGFPYLGYLPAKLCGVPRLETPRLRVEPGSVGLTGRQTGIYPDERPGGWNLIGRTPLELVNLADGYFPLRTGDRVRFKSIDENEFQRLCGQRL